MVLLKKDVLAFSPQPEPYYSAADEWLNTGNSMIADPNGSILAGPLHKKEDILYAGIDLTMLHGTKWNLDVAGHYTRPDAFQLTVIRSPPPVITFRDNRETPAGERERTGMPAPDTEEGEE